MALQLNQAGVLYSYEVESYPWTEYVPNAKCPECDTKAVAMRSYTPDFFLSNGVIIETKGRMTPRDRKIALAMKKEHTDLDIRFVFSLDNKLNKGTDTRYSDWCNKNGIKWALKEVPKEWMK